MVVVGKGLLGSNHTGGGGVRVPIQYKIDILEALKAAGYNTNRLRKEKLLGESVIQKMRGQRSLSWHEIGVVCGLLQCQPGDILEYVPDEQNE